MYVCMYAYTNRYACMYACMYIRMHVYNMMCEFVGEDQYFVEGGADVVEFVQD